MARGWRGVIAFGVCSAAWGCRSGGTDRVEQRIGWVAWISWMGCLWHGIGVGCNWVCGLAALNGRGRVGLVQLVYVWWSGVCGGVDLEA